MEIRTRHVVIAAAAVVLPVVLAGIAAAEEDTQSPLQGADAGAATLGSLTGSFLDAVNGADRPSGADGTETEFPTDPINLVDGPVAGLLRNGPFE
ncbi:hypothetical protein SAMN05443637_12498 [Pseudonocardia thermophila]|jgi:hypothetical protein|uniref:Uncharacterized protein n=1 Tax=Pseudonocardia thermophila TaxID=1848 RepID=A0A1M6ZQ18_PSETH|nr:hypothetical protein [Pseudonocardia thermophila]SHL32433.1 hypothetical protein SAMN05443637_12498 [Pseudonocardia thermophila]